MLRNRLKHLIRYKYNDYIDSLGAKISHNPKRFWSYFRSKTQYRTLSQVIKGDNRTASVARDKAQLFNSYFYPVFFFSNPVIIFKLPDNSTFNANCLEISRLRSLMFWIFYAILTHQRPLDLMVSLLSY